METVKLLSFVLKNVCKLNGHLINKIVKKFKKKISKELKEKDIYPGIGQHSMGVPF